MQLAHTLIIMCAVLNISATVFYVFERYQKNWSILPVLGRAAAGFAVTEVLLLLNVILKDFR